MSIGENLARVREQVNAACARAGRPFESVRLMAVSKVQPVDAIVEAYAAGQRLFGENRVQEVAGKQTVLSTLPGLEMHLIGPLQNNKTGRAAELFQGIDTVESVKTARRLHEAATILGKVLPVLVEIKLSHEESKHGLPPEELGPLLEQTAELSGIEVRGLMTVPPWSENPDAARPYFRQLRSLRDEYSGKHASLVELSMGMSNDFAVAIEEGSNVVRVGTAIFGARPSPQG